MSAGIELLETYTSKSLDLEEEVGGRYAIAAGLLEIARALQKLGVNNAITEMGAIEALSLSLKEAGESISSSLSYIASSVSEAITGDLEYEAEHEESDCEDCNIAN